MKKYPNPTDKLIISELIKNGRASYTKLSKKLKLTPAAVRERILSLIKNKLISINALINPKVFYKFVACIGVEVDPESCEIILRKLRNCPLVFQMMKTNGVHNLILNVVATTLDQIECFVNKRIRSEPGIKHVEINVGNSTSPGFLPLKLEVDLRQAPCGALCNECEYYKEKCPGCPSTIWFRR
jgi:DNA-binding Lrp family transcriptional regulator